MDFGQNLMRCIIYICNEKVYLIYQSLFEINCYRASRLSDLSGLQFLQIHNPNIDKNFFFVILDLIIAQYLPLNYYICIAVTRNVLLLSISLSVTSKKHPECVLNKPASDVGVRKPSQEDLKSRNAVFGTNALFMNTLIWEKVINLSTLRVLIWWGKNETYLKHRQVQVQ